MSDTPIGFHASQQTPDSSPPDYTLAEVSPGQYAYRFNGTPAHYACPVCVDKDDMTVVMQVGPQNTYDAGDLICGACNHVVLGLISNPKR